jgi:hypothetical protein
MRGLTRALCTLVAITPVTSLATEPPTADAVPHSPHVAPATLTKLQVVQTSVSSEFVLKTGVQVEARKRLEPDFITGPETSPVIDPLRFAEVRRRCAAPKDRALREECRFLENFAPDAIKVVGEGTVEIVGPDTVVVPQIVGPGVVPVVPAIQLPQVKGKPRKVDLYTDVAAVGFKGFWRCTGVLVAKDLVLTAAHCLPADTVAFGYDLAKAREEFAVDKVDRAPGGVDVALLRLERATQRKPRPWRLSGDTSAPSGSMTIVGFGSNDVRGTSGFGVMRKNSVETEGWGCDAWRSAALDCAPGTEMVLRSSAGRDTCRGDSGGPVFESVGGETRLVAITSRPIPTRGRPCGSGGIYVRMDAISKWVLNQTAVSKAKKDRAR